MTEVGLVKFVNGVSYLNRPVLVFNGTSNTTVMQCTTDIFTYEDHTDSLVTNASYGL